MLREVVRRNYTFSRNETTYQVIFSVVMRLRAFDPPNSRKRIMSFQFRENPPGFGRVTGVGRECKRLVKSAFSLIRLLQLILGDSQHVK